MPVRQLAHAGLLAAALAAPGLADTTRPPAELPPPGFAGAEYVDSRGCVFLRGGVGDQVTWVARLSRERRQICGLAPTFAPVPVAATVPAAPPASPPVRRSPAPVRVAAVQPDRTARVIATATCPAHAPFARRIASPGGGTKVVCLSKDVGLDRPALPKGYRHAWKDDRLNPLRGLGTVEGREMQDRVWTRQVPARLVDAQPVKSAAAVPLVAGRTAVTGPTPESSTSGGSLVQVGSYAVAANAERARARLLALGLPVTGRAAAVGGRPVQVIYAGPFPDAGAAQEALRKVRAAGFGDAFLRGGRLGR